jgi:hypothetical protein
VFPKQVPLLVALMLVLEPVLVQVLVLAVMTTFHWLIWPNLLNRQPPHRDLVDQVKIHNPRTEWIGSTFS